MKREFFTPPPKVDSQVVILEPLAKPLATESTLALIKLGFIAPRKKLVANLSVGLKMPKERILALFAENGIRMTLDGFTWDSNKIRPFRRSQMYSSGQQGVV